jgi:voltage-gated potassium channel Kch
MGLRTSFIPALNLAQISEFSLVIGAIGVSSGHIDQRFLSVMVYVMVFTSVGSTYAITKNHEIFAALHPLLRRLGLRDLGEEAPEQQPESAKDIVFLGFAHDASSLLHELLEADRSLSGRIAVVDFNPEVKYGLDRRGIQCVYGDISHLDTLKHADVEHAQVLVCTIPDMLLKGTSNLGLLRRLRTLTQDARVIVCAQRFEHAKELYEAGADFVYLPRMMSVRRLREVVVAALNEDLASTRIHAMQEIQVRSEVLP